MVAEVLMRHVRKYVSPVLCTLLACSHGAQRGAGPIRIEEATIDELQAAIMNVSSGLAFVPLPISPVYCATKAGLHSFTESLRVQLKNTKVKVFELAPPANKPSSWVTLTLKT